MSKVKLTNTDYPFMQLFLTTNDLSKGGYQVSLKKGQSIEVDRSCFTNQVTGLVKRKRLKLEELNPPPAKVEQPVAPAPVEEVVLEVAAFPCDKCPEVFESDKKLSKHVKKEHSLPDESNQ